MEQDLIYLSEVARGDGKDDERITITLGELRQMLSSWHSDIMSVTQLARYLNKTREGIRYMMRTGVITPTTVVGKRKYFSKAEIDRLFY